MTHITLANATNVSNYVYLDHDAISGLSVVPYAVPFILILMYGVFHYTKNVAGIIGTGLGFIAVSFTFPAITGNQVIDFTFFILIGLSIMFQGIFSYQKIKKGGQ